MRKKQVELEDEHEIFNQMNAFNIYTKKGLEAALQSYPDAQNFIEKNQHKSYEIVKKESIKKILRIKTDY